MGIQIIFQLSWCPEIGGPIYYCVLLFTCPFQANLALKPLCEGTRHALSKGCSSAWDCYQTRLTLPVLPSVSFLSQTETWCKVEVVPGAECCTLALSNMELTSFRRFVISRGGRLWGGLYEERKHHEVIRPVVGHCQGQRLVNEARMFWLCWWVSWPVERTGGDVIWTNIIMPQCYANVQLTKMK